MDYILTVFNRVSTLKAIQGFLLVGGTGTQIQHRLSPLPNWGKNCREIALVNPTKSSVPTALLIRLYQFDPGNKLPGYYIGHARPDDQSDGPMAFIPSPT